MRLVFVPEDLCEDPFLHVNIGNNVDSVVANISYGHCKGGEHVYIEVVTNATLQIVYRKWTDLVAAVSWFGLASHILAGQILFRSRAIWKLHVTT